MSVRELIALFGGIRPMAAKLGHQSHTTVQGWWDRKIIPAARQREVLNAAEAAAIAITADDLIGRADTPTEAAAA